MNDTARTYPSNTWTIGKLVLTACRQAGICPVIDGCKVWATDGWAASGIAIRVPRGVGRALVIAWREGSWPTDATFHRAMRLPLVGRLFRVRF